MSTNGNGRWFQVAVFLAGLILGGGASSAIGHVQYSALEERISLIDQRLSRIEGRLSIVGSSER